MLMPSQGAHCRDHVVSTTSGTDVSRTPLDLTPNTLGFPHGSVGKESACNEGDPGSIPGLGRSPGEGNGNPLQYSCLENPTYRGGTWLSTVHGVARVGHDLVTRERDPGIRGCKKEGPSTLDSEGGQGPWTLKVPRAPTMGLQRELAPSCRTSMTMETAEALLSSVATTSHVQLLGSWSVASATEEPNCYNFISIH